MGDWLGNGYFENSGPPRNVAWGIHLECHRDERKSGGGEGETTTATENGAEIGFFTLTLEKESRWQVEKNHDAGFAPTPKLRQKEKQQPCWKQDLRHPWGQSSKNMKKNQEIAPISNLVGRLPSRDQPWNSISTVNFSPYAIFKTFNFISVQSEY